LDGSFGSSKGDSARFHGLRGGIPALALEIVHLLRQGHTRPGEPRRNRALISDALLLLTRGDIPLDPTAPPTPAELIECVDLWRQDLGTHHRPKL
jgi:hypothetical protein